MSDNRGSVVGGVILVMLGLAFLFMQVFDDAGGALVPLGLGLAFLIAHAIYRAYGFLVPGGILVGLGAGLLVAETVVVRGDPVVLGLGLGFVSIWAVDLLFARSGPAGGRWWPLIPGAILTTIGVGTFLPDLTDAVVRFGWPLALVALGSFVIWRGLRDRRG